VNLIKKALGVAAVLGGTAVFACSGPNQVVGSDGLPVGGGTAGAGQGSPGAAGNAGSAVNAGSAAVGNATTSGSTPAAELNYEQWQLNTGTPTDGGPLCLPEALPIDPETGNAACFVLSARQETDCSCAAAGYSPVSDELSRVTRQTMRLSGFCSPSIGANISQIPCEEVCVCKVDPAVGSSLSKCQSESEPDAATTGWCYVSDAGDAAQQALVEDCPMNQKQRLRFFGAVTEHPEDEPQDERLFLGCPFPRPVKKLGERCPSVSEYGTKFHGFDVKTVNVEDHSPLCETGICLQNHFQGRVSCPYGQAKGSEDCLVAGGNDAVIGRVVPQLVARPADVASICSCQCAGYGPGPYCTCPENMQCEDLVINLDVAPTPLAGSYCIPAGSQYDPQGDTTTCSGANCGFGHQYD